MQVVDYQAEPLKIEKDRPQFLPTGTLQNHKKKSVKIKINQRVLKAIFDALLTTLSI